MSHLSSKTGEKEKVIGHVVQNLSCWCEHSFDLCLQQFLQLGGTHYNQITRILGSVAPDLWPLRPIKT